ncbi:putative RNA methyltransferase [Clostridium oryzae]|uniref:23S rRNA (Guanine(745)-N(1))-methyltransferase n=1 Tax=Clostridium oryzae TaxID=1450648 RepID=A0A1V4ISE7_9CLOT|nr:methyltransferase domain-containing protein [Clostridium oryzae]OPJ62387.1 23S rRNA (guanine(745)-N(1))-methyltransferase [Clostridium oryzae]
MDTEKKIDKAMKLINESIQLLRCPVCGKQILEVDNKTLHCFKGHCFDVSKKGYINLLNSTVKKEYSKELFEARNYICSIGFYRKLQEELVSLILHYIEKTDSQNIKIMDVGCGEGSHLKYIIDKLRLTDTKKVTGIGIDISKAGISVASREYKDILWCVADLAKGPFNKKSLAVILNILSPANYKEFKRLLIDDGIVIKVVPAENYLKELRENFYSDTKKAEYSNYKIVERLKENLEILYHENLTYSVEMSKQDLEKLISMTPLSWTADNEKIIKFLQKDIKAITVDLLIIVGKMKR